MIKTSNEFSDGYVIVEYEMITTCNKQCSYCYNVAGNRKRQHASYETIRDNILKILSSDNPNIILQLIGGEVMVHERFDDIINLIYDNKKTETKIALFTHTDHDPKFFQDRVSNLMKFGDQVKINCSLHLDGIDRQKFLDNMLIANTLSNCTSFIIVDDRMIDNLDWYSGVLEQCHNFKWYPLIYDKQSDTGVLSQFMLYRKLTPIADRVDTKLILDGRCMPYHIGRINAHIKYGLNFSGLKCHPLIYTINVTGDISLHCSDEVITNISNFDKQLFNERVITCSQEECDRCFGILHVEENNES